MLRQYCMANCAVYGRVISVRYGETGCISAPSMLLGLRAKGGNAAAAKPSSGNCRDRSETGMDVRFRTDGGLLGETEQPFPQY